MLSFCNLLIRWGFYSIFLFVPLIFFGDTSELFEFNKLWLTFGLTIIIGAAWITKMILQRRIFIQRTPLDIPILLFLASQVLSTIFSLDPHVSWWGYYSRFNGGLSSMLAYIFLYYALVSNYRSVKKNDLDGKKFIGKLLIFSLISGLITSLWGLPSHFGYDPTCWLFRGTLDVSCWTNAFQPKVRIFSTMGQPDWLAAYLCILIPISIAFAINSFNKFLASKPQHVSSIMYYVSSKYGIHTTYYILLTTLFYIDFLYTRSKGSFIAFAIAAVIFLVGLLLINYSKQKIKIVSILVILLAVGFFFAGSPFAQFTKFTYDGVKTHFVTPQPTTTTKTTAQPTPPPNPITGELGGTDSGKIRLFVWKGALDAWLHNPLFGTGVETFAFAYYKYRPAGHNLTSEWDYLYNKAHNEYLNYLATTGAFGLGSYLAIIFVFLFICIKLLSHNSIVQLLNNNNRTIEQSSSLGILALLTAYLTIIISNFFGFSVVIVNIYFFIIPAFAFVFMDKLDPRTSWIFPKLQTTNHKLQPTTTGIGGKIAICATWIVALYMLGILLNYWNADKTYGLGMNLDRANQFQSAFEPLQQAVNSRPGEPLYKDELSVNVATLALLYAEQKDTATAEKLAQTALQLSNEVTTNYPNNVTFWKSRVRVMYTLSQIDPQYLRQALEAIKKAYELAPTDAKISYNLGLLYAQNNQLDAGITMLRKTIQLKPDYRDAYFALATILHQQAVDPTSNRVTDQTKQQEAVGLLRFILTKLAPHDTASQDTLKAWGEK